MNLKFDWNQEMYSEKAKPAWLGGAVELVRYWLGHELNPDWYFYVNNDWGGWQNNFQKPPATEPGFYLNTSRYGFVVELASGKDFIVTGLHYLLHNPTPGRGLLLSSVDQPQDPPPSPIKDWELIEDMETLTSPLVDASGHLPCKGRVLYCLHYNGNLWVKAFDVASSP